MGSCNSVPAQATSKGALPEGVSVFFVLGGPGSGKGTQCEKISAQYDCQHISAGDLLREEVQRGTQLGKECDALMKEGKLVPIETTLALLQSAMLKSTQKTFLIDGFPRAIEQATRFEAEIQPCTAVLFFDCSEEVMKQRLLERGKSSGRADDNQETIQKRLQTFIEASAPVAKFYETQGKCYRVSAEEDPDVVFGKVQTALDQYLTINKPEAATSEPVPTATEENTASGAGITESDSPPAAAEIPPQVEAESKTTGQVVFVLGGPGSGKGTQCEKIVADYGYKHISVGDLLRAEVASESELGKECDALMKEGKLVPLEITLDLLKKAISMGTAECYLIDGFPRSIEQAEFFEKEVASCDCVLYFDCSEEVMLERMTERSKQSGRADDNPETMQKRLATFVEVSAAVVQFYSEKGKCHNIPAERDPAEIYADVQAILNSLKPQDVPQKEPEADAEVPQATYPEQDADEREEATDKNILILQNQETKTGAALCAGFAEKGWSAACQEYNDDIDLASFVSKAIVWNPVSSDDSSVSSSFLEQLRIASEKGVVLFPSLEAYVAATDEEFVKKITERDPVEGTESIVVDLVFETPIEVVIQTKDSEKEEVCEVRVKPDDPEAAPLIQRLIDEDLGKIKSELKETLPPLWSAVYQVVQENDEAPKGFALSGVNCMPLESLTERLQYADSITSNVINTLSAEN